MSKANTVKMDPLIEGYLSYLDKVGRKTPRTIVDVRCTLRRAVDRLERVRPGIELWHLKLEDYLHWLEAERQDGCTESSLAKYLSHVRGLLEYAWRSGRAERNVLDGFSLQHTVRRTVPNSLNLEEAERLVQATTASGPTARRDRLIILLLYGCGLRTKELCALDVAHVNRERHELAVLKAKGDRPRAIPIPEGVYTELLAYLMEHGKRGPMFRTSTRKRRLRAGDVCGCNGRRGARWTTRRRYSLHTSAQFRDALDGPWRRPGHHCLADGTSQPAGDWRVLACVAGALASRGAHAADRKRLEGAC